MDQVENISTESNHQPVLIFKHSTTCGVSRTALDRLERNYKPEELANLKSYFLDLKNYREVSKAIADKYQVIHESPQVIIIKNGKAVFNASHFEIDYRQIKEVVI